MTAIGPDLLERVRAALRADYEVIRLLGQGGMATVFLARERALKRLVAIKVLDPDLGASPIFRSRFEREAQTAASLQHPHIVPIYRVGDAGGMSYYAMGYVEGESLADRLRGRGRLEFDETRRITREVAQALGAAHRRGIIHRDVKPHNVLIERESGRVMVTDFGIASVTVADARGSEGDALTAAGMVMGTPRYMSPEQATGERDLTPASDLYALGVMVYEMVSGHYPYRLGEPPNFLLAHLTGDVIPLVTRVGDVPDDLDRVTGRLLLKAADRRFTSADEVVAELGTVEATAELNAASRRHRRIRPLLMGALVAIAVGVWAAFGFGRSSGLPDGVDPRRSILIGFFDNTTQDPQLDWVRVGGVNLLSKSLQRWRDLRVVDERRLLDLTRRAGLDAEQRLSQDDVLQLAREAGVWTATLGSVVRTPDSLFIDVQVYDVASREQLSSPRVALAASGDVTAAFGRLADEILDVAGVARSQRIAVEPPTHSIAAYRAYVEGIEARSRWDIPVAQAAFRRAVTEDSSFALAWYELSQVSVEDVFTAREPQFIAYADSALRYAGGRPPREQKLINAYQALLSGDAPRARRLSSELVAEDSTLIDAWMVLGSASMHDLTLVRTADGREQLPANYTVALRAFRRSQALDGGDHRTFAMLARVLSFCGVQDNQVIPAYRDPPPGNLLTMHNRIPRRYYTPLLLPNDSIAMVPAESLSLRFAPRVVDSLRREARAQATSLLRRWIAIAPDEGAAYLTLTQLETIDKQYEAALTALQRAESLKTPQPVPYAVQRLALLLLARRYDEALQLGDSLAPAGKPVKVPGSQLFADPLLGYLMLQGRTGEASRLRNTQLDELVRFQATPSARRGLELSRLSADLRVASRGGIATRAALTEFDREARRLIAAAPEDERAELRRTVTRQVAFAAAALGDTALLARWRGEAVYDSLKGFDAAAAAVAGDRVQAERLLAEGIRDTTSNLSHVFALAATAEALGRIPDALRLYERLDTLEVDFSGAASSFLLLPRSLIRRGALYAQRGDTAAATAAYERALKLWRHPDPALQPQRRAAERALADLTQPARDR